jgi:hypothetical protein
MGSFEEALSSNDIAVATVVFGGPAISYDSMPVYMQNLFMKQMFDLNNRDLESFISQHTDPRDWYMHYAHLFSLAVPVYISVAMKNSIVYSAPITNIQQTIDSLVDILYGEKLNVYGYEEYGLVNRYLHFEKKKGNIVNNNDFRVFCLSECLEIEEMFETLDEHIIAMGYEIGEFISSPHYLYYHAHERLKAANDTKALSLWKIANL